MSDTLAKWIKRDMYGPSSNFGRVPDGEVDNRLLTTVRYADESIGKRSSDLLAVETEATMTLTSSANADAKSMAQSPRIIRPCAIVIASNPSDAIVASSDSSSISSDVDADDVVILSSLRERVESAVSLDDVRVVDDDEDDDGVSSTDCCWWTSSLDSRLDKLYSSSRVIRRAFPIRMVVHR